MRLNRRYIHAGVKARRLRRRRWPTRRLPAARGSSLAPRPRHRHRPHERYTEGAQADRTGQRRADCRGATREESSSTPRLPLARDRSRPCVHFTAIFRPPVALTVHVAQLRLSARTIGKTEMENRQRRRRLKAAGSYRTSLAAWAEMDGLPLGQTLQYRDRPAGNPSLAIARTPQLTTRR